MEIFALLLLLAPLLAELSKDRTEPKKSEEKELTDALSKYLSKGVNVQIKTGDEKKS